MNRKIKFRAWDKELEEFTEFPEYKVGRGSGRACLGLDGSLYCESAGGFEETDEELYEVVFSTGLKDKNGMEIYEGDIVSTDLDRPYLIVEFRNGAFMFQCHDNGKDYYDFMTTTNENSNFTKYHEVIGNIYENPELLEG